jgi:hypothetical protein
MSHITKIDLQVKDLNALDNACARLGLELVREQKTFKWYGRFIGDTVPPKELMEQGYTAAKYGTCAHAIRVKGNAAAYEIGLIKRADGKGYMLAWDSFLGGYGLCARVGYDQKDLGATKLKDWYAAEVARKQMSKQGFQVRMVQRDRKVQVLCSK